MKRLYAASNLPEAHLLRHLLWQAGIDARVHNENLSAALGEIPFPEVYPEIWIARDRDLLRATEILREYEGTAPDGISVNCARCGEESPPNFQICWNCRCAI
jgi:hypothetical protein